MSPETLGLLLVLGAWVGIDSAAFLQVMVSQPLVASWLAGAVVGAPGTGLALGILLQGIWIRDLPVGGRMPPVLGPAAVVGAVLAADGVEGGGSAWGRLVLPPAPILAASIVVAIAVAEVGRRIQTTRARHRVAWVRRAEAAARADQGERFPRFNLLAVAETAGWGMLLVAGGLATGWVVERALSWLPEADGRWVAYPVLGVGLGQSLALLGKSRTAWRWLLGSLVAVLALWIAP
jgi:mannose/fructose/N-acetylgalactosamine-specific phosphotransferase system component IIC